MKIGRLVVAILLLAGAGTSACSSAQKSDYDEFDPRYHNPYLESYSVYDPRSTSQDLEEAKDRKAWGISPQFAAKKAAVQVTPVAVASPSPVAVASPSPVAPTPSTRPLNSAALQVVGVPDVVAELKVWCSQMRSEVKKLKWNIEPCPDGIEWKLGGMSVLGRPLVYTVLGNENGEEPTLILTMVHSDEVTPLYIGLQLVNWLKDQKELLAKTRIVIAPLVNPDGFFRRVRTRTNARGVDVNRNFATRDWNESAIKLWKQKYGSDRRRYPGKVPESEPETIFQKALIEALAPKKILSIHSPLSMMDYDGPDTGIPLARFMNDYGREYLKLKHKLENLSWRFYPGSLGNYAGRELGIPTMTLELPTADATKGKDYWEKFEEGAKAFIGFKSVNPY